MGKSDGDRWRGDAPRRGGRVPVGGGAGAGPIGGGGSVGDTAPGPPGFAESPVGPAGNPEGPPLAELPADPAGAPAPSPWEPRTGLIATALGAAPQGERSRRWRRAGVRAEMGKAGVVARTAEREPVEGHEDRHPEEDHQGALRSARPWLQRRPGSRRDEPARRRHREATHCGRGWSSTENRRYPYLSGNNQHQLAHTDWH